jgi:serine/threonine protein phosphatase PrpC
MQSSEQVCRDLVRLANERGGTDNVTVLVGRVRPTSR